MSFPKILLPRCSFFGSAMYGCGKCGTHKFVPFRCHSRFCPTCGTKYSIDRTTSMSFKIINVQHRHCVFTIDSELRHFFLKDHEFLGLLFETAQSVILRMFHKDNITEKFTPGFILVLHTFGRDIKCNPAVVTKYIGRYLGRPVISTSHIDSYDGENVTFRYNRHEDDQLVVETIPVMDLLQGLFSTYRKSVKSFSLLIAGAPTIRTCSGLTPIRVHPWRAN